jgi:hypothetical protein|tara:strand:+ start:1826 stop:2191 length:366 start_codon:yes stop_codon:yes gene_type:complete
MGTYSKIILSGSTDGEGIIVTGLNPSQGTVIHTSVTGAANSIDEMWVYAWSSVTTALELSFDFGVTTATGSRFTHTITGDDKKGLVLMIPGLVGRNAKVLSAYATAVGTVNVFGFVNRFAS